MLFEDANSKPFIYQNSILTLKSVSEMYIMSIARYIKNIKSIENIKISLLKLGEMLI